MAGDWGKFNWQDPFNLDDQLTDEERLVRDTAANYAQEKLAPRRLDELFHQCLHCVTC